MFFPIEAVPKADPDKIEEIVEVGERCKVDPQQKAFFCLVPVANGPGGNGCIAFFPYIQSIGFTIFNPHEHH